LKLTEDRILKLACPAGKKDILVSDGAQRGLYIRVSSTACAGKEGGRTYLAQYSYAGQKRRIPLGDLTLAVARSAARRSWATWRRAVIQPTTARRRRWKPGARPRTSS
jgi:hypothetical protein